MIWREVARFPVPSDGFVIVWPTVDDVPEVWAARVYHEARARSAPDPGWTYLVESAAAITHWAQLPPLPVLAGQRSSPLGGRGAEPPCASTQATSMMNPETNHDHD